MDSNNASSQAVKQSIPLQLAIPSIREPGLAIHLHLTIYSSTILLFLSTSNGGNDANIAGLGHSSAALGSFVYAMPDKYDDNKPISTTLFTSTTSLDLTTRLAKLLARKTVRGVYLGSNVESLGCLAPKGNEHSERHDLERIGMHCQMDREMRDEMNGFKRVVDVIMGQVQDHDRIV